MSGTQKLARVFKELAEDQELIVLSVDDDDDEVVDEEMRVEFRAEDASGDIFRIIIMKEDADVFAEMCR